MIQSIKIFFFFTSCTIFLITTFDCKKTIVDPPVIEQPQDTTSHNFAVTRIDTLGFLFSSANGVDIVDENNIWVAGMFTEKDTNGEILYKKNLAHWDGIKWNLFGIKMQGFGGERDTSIQELITIKVFSDSCIIVTSLYSSFARYNGTKWISFAPPEGVWKYFWARSPNEIYFVGDFGSVTYYNGQTFTKINTGLTNPPLTDVWGDENGVYAVGYGSGTTEGTETVFLSGDKTSWRVYSKYEWTTLDPNDKSLIGGMVSVYRANKNSKLWLLSGWGNARIFEISSLLPFTAKKFFEFPYDYSASVVRGTADNDLYIAGWRNAAFYQFNGKTWYKYEPPVNNFHLAYSKAGFVVNGNLWGAVGFSTGDVAGQAMVIIGKHN